MLRRRLQLAKNQEKVKVLAKTHNADETNSFWFVTMAAAIFAAAFYFFGFFFGFTGGRALTKS